MRESTAKTSAFWADTRYPGAGVHVFPVTVIICSDRSSNWKMSRCYSLLLLQKLDMSDSLSSSSRCKRGGLHFEYRGYLPFTYIGMYLLYPSSLRSSGQRMIRQQVLHTMVRQSKVHTNTTEHLFSRILGADVVGGKAFDHDSVSYAASGH